MPTLAAALDFARLEGRNFRGHQLATAPTSPAPVTGQMYYNTTDNTLYWWDGAVWQSAKGGAPGGAAGGDLTGTYPNPQIAAGVVVNADVNAAAAIARSKLDFGAGLVNADIAAAAAIVYGKLALTASIVNGDIASAAAIAYAKLSLSNSIVNGDIAPAAAIALSKLAVDPLARANHTGTQLAATVSNFDTQVRTSRLDQMAAPTAAVPLNAQKITGLADGTTGTDAVTKQQLDAVSSGLDVKASVHVASTGNLTLAAPGANIDGVAMVAGDRVLLKNQTAPAENGIYVWNGAAVAMTRAADADASAEVTAGMFTFVEEGTANSDSGWVLTTNAPIVLGTTGLVFAQFSGAGQIIDGNGLTKTGNTLDVNVDASSIEINADILRVKAAGVTNAMLAGSIDATTKLTGAVPVTNGGTGQATAKAGRETGLGAAGYYSSATHGAGTTITITQATHGLRATRGLLVQVQDEAVAGGAPGSVVEADVAVASNGDVVVTFGAAMSANTYRVTIIG
jgi:hypothetical protein